MKFVIKESDKYFINSKATFKYLIYLMTEDNIPVNCEIVIGNNDDAMNYISEQESKMDTKLPIEFVRLEEFHNQVI